MAIYIDPTQPTNGVGTTADPKNTWDGITLVANETYRQKRGTVCQLPAGVSKYIHANILASNPATPLTLEAYYYADGSDEPSLPRPEIISNVLSNGVGTINIRKSSNVVVRNLKINAVVTASYGVAGIRINAQNTGVYSNIKILNCEILNHGYAITPVLSSSDANTELTDLLIDGNDIHDNSSGIYWFFFPPLNSYIRRLTITNNKIHDNGQRVTPGVVPCGISGNYASGSVTTDPTRAFKDVLIGNNQIYNCESYSIAVYNCYNETLVSRVYGNHVHDNNLSELYDAHPIWVARCFGIIVERNRIENNSGYAAGPIGTACGVIVDTDVGLALGGDGVIVRHNVMDGGWRGYTFGGSGSEAMNAQAGVFVIDNTNCTIEDNFIRGFHSGIGTYANSGGTPNTKVNGLIVRRNTVVDLIESSSQKAGVGISLRSGMTTVIENNIFANCRQGIWVSSALALPTERNNCVYAPRNGVYYAQSATIDITTPTVALDASSTTADPQLDENGRPRAGSSSLGKVATNGLTRDAADVYRDVMSARGAYEYVRPRPARALP